MEEKNIQVIKETTEHLFSLLGITSAFTLTQGEDNIEIVLETEENGILIGYHGETLEALQLVLSLCVAKALGTYVRISVEVGEYKKNRMDYLQNLVARTREQVLETSQGVSLPSLKSWERRFVHTLLKDDTEVMSESSGEGRDRTLTISPKNQ